MFRSSSIGNSKAHPRGHWLVVLGFLTAGMVIALIGAHANSVSADSAHANRSLGIAAQTDTGPRIVGGQPATPGEYPYQIALVQANAAPYDGQFCGGSLIDPLWVLTAAHCVEDSTAAQIEVIAGIHELAAPEPGIQRRALAQIVIHPGWNTNTNDNDIALLKLAQPIAYRQGGGGQLPIQGVVPVPTTIGALTGVTSTVTGWGNTLGQPNPGGINYPSALHEVEVPIISNQACSTSYDGITDNMLCAGFTAGGKDSCQGDSGGPLVVRNNALNRWEQAGVVSFGSGCARPNFPGIYTRVSRYTDWINNLVNPVVAADRVYLPVALKVPPAPPPPPPVQGIPNGNFESGPNGDWDEGSAFGYAIILQENAFPGSVQAHGGEWAAWLGGENNEISYVAQTLKVPAGASYLVYYHWIASADSCGYDFGGVIVNGAVVDVYDLCDDTSTNGWQKHAVNLGSYAGQTVGIQIRAETDESLNSNLFVDDVSFAATGTTAVVDGPAVTGGWTGKTDSGLTPRGGSSDSVRLFSDGARPDRQK